jgi:hypothetical protein
VYKTLTRANITVSEPWEFHDENGGFVTFDADVIAKTGDGFWVLRLDVPARYDGENWNYAIPTPRHVGQRYFDDPTESDRSANILFIREEQACSESWRREFNSRRKPNTPWAIGSCELIAPA